jgi:hypothetical protein
MAERRIALDADHWPAGRGYLCLWWLLTSRRLAPVFGRSGLTALFADRALQHALNKQERTFHEIATFTSLRFRWH